MSSGVPLEARFWSKVDVTTLRRCWEWRGGKTDLGYGHFSLNGRCAQAHRVAYELLVGEIPESLFLDHVCRNPGCVNPAHLEVVTNAENVRRGQAPNVVASRLNQCLNGHPLSGDNVYRYNGKRRCRICSRVSQAAFRERQRAKRSA